MIRAVHSKFILVNVLLVLSTASLVGQGELPIDMYTGTPTISVPLGSITSRDLSDDLYIYYDARGIRVAQTSGNYGMGWSLISQSITREVRGLPDDFTGTGAE